jgi:hypothetical protein
MNLTWFMAWYMINGALNHVGFRASHAPYPELRRVQD